MSRLDRHYLTSTNKKTWREAYAAAAAALGQPPSTFKNLRDEFDPVHGNLRRGWHRRPLRTSRLRVLGDLANVSDEALIALTLSILSADDGATEEAVDSLSSPLTVAAGVAERLLTGKRAEDFVIENCESLFSISRDDLIDLRLSAQGYDFAFRGRPNLAVEVKGLRSLRGDILFTDREWSEAKARRSSYWLALVRNIEAQPFAEVIADPYESIAARCVYQKTITALWRARV